MARWTPKKQALASQLPEGSEDVAFRKSQDGPTIVKAHAVILANQSDRFHGDFYPIRAGRTLPIVLCDWAQVLCDWAPITECEPHCEVALKVFVKMLYGTGPTLASLDIKTLLGVHSLATYYCIPGLVEEMVEKIKGAKIPLPELPSCISFRCSGIGGVERREAVNVSIEETLKSTPGRVRIIRTNIDLSSLKKHLSRILPTGTNLDEVLDAYTSSSPWRFVFRLGQCMVITTSIINEKLNILVQQMQVICGATSVPQKFSPSPLVDQVYIKMQLKLRFCN